jgi:hypothetical protein
MPAPLEDDLTKVITPSRVADGELELVVADGWQQGRGAFGGLVLGALARAIEAFEPEPDRVLRSLMGELSAPVMQGPAIIRVRAVRRGSGVSTFRATLWQDGEERAGATAVLGRARPTLTPWNPVPPVMPPFASVEPVLLGPPFAPDFSRFFEYRITGPLPFSGGTDRSAAGWIRPRRCSAEALGAPEIVAIVDAWIPSAFTTESGPRPVGTVAFAFQYFPPKSPLSPREPLFHRATSVAGQDGFVVENRELWTAAGELVALNPQTLVWIR